MVNADSVEIQNPSLASFLSALIFYLVVGGIVVGLFFVLRRRKPLTYAPRLVSGTRAHSERVVGDAAKKHFVLAAVDRLFFPEHPVYLAAGPDAAIFLRSLQSGAFQFAVFATIALPMLLPVDATFDGPGKELDKLTMSNVTRSDSRMWVHVTAFALFSLITIGVISLDTRHFARIRMRYMQEAVLRDAAPFKAKAIVVMGLTGRESDREGLLQVFGGLPGGVEGVYPCLSHQGAEKAAKERDTHIRMLEIAVCRLVSSLCYRKQRVRPMVELVFSRAVRKLFPGASRSDGWRELAALDQLKHHCARIVQHNQEIRAFRATPREHAGQTCAAFVVFNTPQAAQDAVALATRRRWYGRRTCRDFNRRFNGLDPSDVDWRGVGIKRGPVRLYSVLRRATIVIIILLWGVPVVFVSMLSSLTELGSTGLFRTISEWPTPLSGIVEGVFPPMILGLLQWCIPELFRFILSFEVRPATWHIELTLIDYIFFFEFMDAFLVPVAATTLFSGLAEFIANPANIARTIFFEIPTVSTFFMSYVLMRALTNGPMEICRVVHVLKYKLQTLFSGRTPRNHVRLASPSAFQYTEHIPSHALVFLLGQFYSPIAPLMTVTATLYYVMYTHIFVYKFVHVYNDKAFQLGGRIAQKILCQRWIALYMAEVSFCASIIIRTSTRRTASSILQLVVALAVPIATVVLHVVIRRRQYPDLVRPVPAQTEPDDDDDATDLCSASVNAEASQTEEEEEGQEEQEEPPPPPSHSAPLETDSGYSGTRSSASSPCDQAMADWAEKQRALSAEDSTPKNSSSRQPSPADCAEEAPAVPGSSGAAGADPESLEHAVWPHAMADPGYSLVWLPLLPAASAARKVNISRILAQIGAGSDQQRPAASAVGPVLVDASVFLDHLYSAIDSWLGHHGRVVTSHARLDRHRVRTTTLLSPDDPAFQLPQWP
ncbi:phosphate metabolism protein 7 [Coemansia javaensis]|uniref:Phosphate metabolism protein 7 n=1 Tax=Coemansia javaensis TaxID=2761396 RepID=A0A9W8HJ60_9FUNG|nr:phosphate metabolism protein 7 [Coemansia javaensis]